MTELTYQVTYQVGHGSYDSDGNSGFWYMNNSALQFGSIAGSYYQWVGITWYYPTIPVGAIIVSAYIQLYVSKIVGTTPDTMHIYFDDSDSTSYASSYADISGRTRTTANIDYAIPAGSSGWVNTDDISPIIQELVNSYNYSAGDKMMTAIMYSASFGSGYPKYALVTSYDGNPSFSPKLVIEYVMPHVGGAQIIGLELL